MKDPEGVCLLRHMMSKADDIFLCLFALGPHPSLIPVMTQGGLCIGWSLLAYKPRLPLHGSCPLVTVPSAYASHFSHV